MNDDFQTPKTLPMQPGTAFVLRKDGKREDCYTTISFTAKSGPGEQVEVFETITRNGFMKIGLFETLHFSSAAALFKARCKLGYTLYNSYADND